jgi:two-component system phosphate regulon sensor histidine kinase PhoR
VKRRIYLSIIGLVLPCVLILSALLSLLFHNAARKQEFAAVRGHATLVSDLIGSGISGDFKFSDYISYAADAPRMTLIAPDGNVLLDSRTAAENMENHADRPEVIDALKNGTGESLRYSDTFKVEMYYYAMRLSDGNVLRVSRQVVGLAGVFTLMLPAAAAVTILILVIANFAARRLTAHVIAPLENIDFDSDNTAVYDELAPYAKKIDQQKLEIEEKIEALSDRADTIEAITVNMKEGLVLIDVTGLVLTANASAREIFNDDMEKKNILHIYRDADFQQAVKQCLSGEHIETQLERAERVYNMYLSPVCSSGAHRGAVILFHDATERNRAEKQRREFSANVSHELKTPLTTISALSEMIENGIAKQDDIKSFAARITEQAGRLLVLIDDIIRLSEFDEGGGAKENTVFDLWELTETVIRALKDHAGSVDIRLTGERFDISANLRMIDELLYNLIDNGVKYNKDGGSVTVELERVESGLCRISVSDTGIGIPAQNQPHVFERFYRVDRSRSKKTGGTGLGLSIVKHITEFHDGRIELSSSEDTGTTVTCYIRYLHS